MLLLGEALSAYLNGFPAILLFTHTDSSRANRDAPCTMRRVQDTNGLHHRFVWNKSGHIICARRVQAMDGLHHRFVWNKSGHIICARRVQAMDGLHHPIFLIFLIAHCGGIYTQTCSLRFFEIPGSK